MRTALDIVNAEMGRVKKNYDRLLKLHNYKEGSEEWEENKIMRMMWEKFLDILRVERDRLIDLEEKKSREAIVMLDVCNLWEKYKRSPWDCGDGLIYPEEFFDGSFDDADVPINDPYHDDKSVHQDTIYHWIGEFEDFVGREAARPQYYESSRRCYDTVRERRTDCSESVVWEKSVGRGLGSPSQIASM